jgi:proteasome accessory factor B
MSSAKTERLVNLTMALLATPRYLQKSEIFRKVAGYTGSQETKERMFERDKDDLRSLGIDIEVASHDPLFEDEPGYRIKPERFQLPIEEFNAEELTVLSAALGLWSNTGLNHVAANAIRRLGNAHDSFSLHDEGRELEILSEESLVELSSALANRSTIHFQYRKANKTELENRRINPLGLSAWHGAWYVVGEDLDRKDIRVFKASRIASKIEISSRRGMYEIPEDFDVRDYLIMYSRDLIEITAFIKKGSGHEIRNRAISIDIPGDKDLALQWDLISYQAESEELALSEALWFSDVLVIQKPDSLRSLVLNALKKVMAHHG